MTDNFIRSLASVIALAFASTPALADGLADDIGATGRFIGTFSFLLGTVPAVQVPSAHAGAISKEFREEFILKPSDQVRVMDSPKRKVTQPDGSVKLVPVSTNLLRTIILVPPTFVQATEGFTMCTQLEGAVVGAYQASWQGELGAVPVIPNPEGSTRPACNATILAAKNKLEQRLEKANPPGGTTGQK